MNSSKTKMKKWTAVDLYFDSGAVTEGLKREGIRVLAAIDNEPIACNTYRLNQPEVNLVEGDIRMVDESVICDQSRIDLLVVCAPCQPFSSQNRRKDHAAPRADLVLESLRFIRALQPKIVFFENVPGITLSGKSGLLRKQLGQQGYFLGEPKSLNAADFGVPQRRVRSIMVASRHKYVTEHFYQFLLQSAKVSVRDAIAGLRSLSAGERDPHDAMHFPRKYSDIGLRRLLHVKKDGVSRFTIPYNLQLECHKNTKAYPNVYGRMKWDDAAPTLTTGCTDITRGRFAHPEDDRAITLREAALLQTFSKKYLFCGNSGQIVRQIGNAVPVNMARSFAKSIKDCLECHHA